MTEKTYITSLGAIHYWTNEIASSRQTLVLLPGLTADHRLFDKQVETFQDEYNVLVWDAPGHAASRPFSLTFTLEDKARWLHDILQEEGIENPIFVGQSMGGYVSQMYLQLFPGEIAGFVSVDSAPLQRKYMANWEIWSLKHVEPIYKWYPWKALIRDGARGCAETEYGRKLMVEMMSTYQQAEYAALCGHGYRMLAEAVERDLPYQPTCHVLLICGEKDKAGSAKRYNLRWAQTEGYRLEWILGAGHNSNTDKPEQINALIRDFAVSCK